jgi:hypothetical protein
MSSLNYFLRHTTYQEGEEDLLHLEYTQQYDLDPGVQVDSPVWDSSQVLKVRPVLVGDKEELDTCAGERGNAQV